MSLSHLTAPAPKQRGPRPRRFPSPPLSLYRFSCVLGALVLATAATSGAQTLRFRSAPLIPVVRSEGPIAAERDGSSIEGTHHADRFRPRLLSSTLGVDRHETKKRAVSGTAGSGAGLRPPFLSVPDGTRRAETTWHDAGSAAADAGSETSAPPGSSDRSAGPEPNGAAPPATGGSAPTAALPVLQLPAPDLPPVLTGTIDGPTLPD